VLDEAACAGKQVACPHCGSKVTTPITTIIYTCPHSNCSRGVKIDTTLKGDGLRCPGCSKPIMLPIQRANMIICLCKRCEKIIEVSISEAGKLLPCPKCDAFIRGPELNEIVDAAATVSTIQLLSPPDKFICATTVEDQVFSILVVDDNRVDQHLTGVQLRKIRSFKRGIELDFAMDGEEALAKLSKHDFALVVLDWNLPVLGQGEVLRYLRKNDSRIPVVVISGVEHRHLADELTALKGTFLSKDMMTPETFHVAICMALTLAGFNVSHFFETRK